MSSGYIKDQSVGITPDGSDGDLSRVIYELRERIDQLEAMRGKAFSHGVVRVSFMLPEIGLKTTF